MERPKNPIKVVSPDHTDYFRPDTGGGSRKIFGDITPATLAALASTLTPLAAQAAAASIPIVAKVRLRPEALAKSHRPIGLFANTCPVIGGLELGTLLVSADLRGIQRLAAKISHAETKTALADVSTIQSISGYSVDDALRPWARDQLADLVAAARGVFKCRLFRHGEKTSPDYVRPVFLQILQAAGHDIADRVRPLSRHTPDVLVVRGVTLELAERLARFVGLQSLHPLDRFGCVLQAGVRPARRTRRGIAPSVTRWPCPSCAGLECELKGMAPLPA